MHNYKMLCVCVAMLTLTHEILAIFVTHFWIFEMTLLPVNRKASQCLLYDLNTTLPICRYSFDGKHW